tara:strand:- start:15223 stop:15540 length:318 start_codon:yes stop_codon:yes gene_type:complete
MDKSLTQAISVVKLPNETLTQHLHRVRKPNETLSQASARIAKEPIQGLKADKIILDDIPIKATVSRGARKGILTTKAAVDKPKTTTKPKPKATTKPKVVAKPKDK